MEHINSTRFRNGIYLNFFMNIQLVYLKTIHLPLDRVNNSNHRWIKDLFMPNRLSSLIDEIHFSQSNQIE